MRDCLWLYIVCGLRQETKKKLTRERTEKIHLNSSNNRDSRAVRIDIFVAEKAFDVQIFVFVFTFVVQSAKLRYI